MGQVFECDAARCRGRHGAFAVPASATFARRALGPTLIDCTNPLRRWSLAAALAATAALTLGCAAPPPSPPPEPRSEPAPAPAPPRAGTRAAAGRDRVRRRRGARRRAAAAGSAGSARQRRARSGHRPADRRQHRPADQRHGADGSAARRPDHAARAGMERAAADARRAGVAATAPDRHADGDQHQERQGRERRRRFASASCSSTWRRGKLVAKRVDRATLATVDAEPTALFRDSPTWALDPTRRPTSSRARAAAPATRSRPRYLRRLPAAAMINEAALAFADNKPAEAYRLYREARGVAERDDLRVLNGLYATSWKTGRKKEAAETFGRIVAIGLETRRCRSRCSSIPERRRCCQSPDLQAQYAVWLQEVANQVGARESCLRVSATPAAPATAAANEVLSQKRAAVIKSSARARRTRSSAPRITADGRRLARGHRRPRHRRPARRARSAGRVPDRRLQLTRQSRFDPPAASSWSRFCPGVGGRGRRRRLRFGAAARRTDSPSRAKRRASAAAGCRRPRRQSARRSRQPARCRAAGRADSLRRAEQAVPGARSRLRAGDARPAVQRARPGLVVRRQVPRPPHRQRRGLRHVRDDRGAPDLADPELRADPQSGQRPRDRWCASTTAARSIPAASST